MNSKKKPEEQVIQSFPHRCPYCNHLISYDPFDTFDGVKPRFLNRGKKHRSELALSLVEGSTLSIPRALVLSAVEGSDRGVEWVDLKIGENELQCPSCKKIYIKVVGDSLEEKG